MHRIRNYESTLNTTRLCLEPLMASHAAAMFRILSDEQLYSFTGDEPPESEVALETRYRYLETRKSPDETQLWLNWRVSLAKSDTPIGYVQATISETNADIAWVVGLKWQGNGYASEAAGALVRWLTENGVRKIRCLINPNHMASQGVASNASFNKSNVMEDGEEVWLV